MRLVQSNRVVKITSPKYADRPSRDLQTGRLKLEVCRMKLSAADLKRKPWEADSSVPASIFEPIGMVGPEERRSYWWLGKYWLGDQGCIVDAGAFVGASSVAFASGAAAAGRRSFQGGPILHAFDYFSVIDDYVRESISEQFSPIEVGESYLPIFERQTASYRDMIRTHPGDFLQHRWDGTPIEILFIDIAKTASLNSNVAAQFFPSLLPGRSIILQQDYFHCWHPYIHITMEYLRDHLELLDDHVEYQTAIWLLSSSIPQEKLQRLVSYDFNATERLALLDRLIMHSSQQMRPMIQTVKLWQLCLDKDYDAAFHAFTELDRSHDLRKSHELWARQALEIEARIPGEVRRPVARLSRTSSATAPAARVASSKIANLPAAAINRHISFDDIIAKYPSFHRQPDGTPWFLGVSGDTLKAFASHLEPGMRTIETGAGFSSLAFVIKGTHHTAICPDDYLERNIRNWCDDWQIDHSRLNYIRALSQDVVPSLEGEYDFAFIDGDHAFPMPQIDFYYLSRRLKVGGYLAIDDTNIWTGAILVQHLTTDCDWELVSEHDGKTSIFKLIAPFRDKGFGRQPFVLANSRNLPSEYYTTLKR
jgi:predicted O-methyltransferase YrrM